MNNTDLAFAGIAYQAELVRRREVSSCELLDVCLDRIAELDPSLNAFRCVLASEARKAATVADRRIAAGDVAHLLGVPIAVKDEVELSGTVNAHGSAAFDEVAASDDVLVRRLREAGAIIIGKTNLPELGICGFTESDANGITRNPWAPGRTPGGSSGGSAAAVSAGLVGCASASDGMGSIRIPAAFTGLFGLKPQRGRIALSRSSGSWNGLIVSGCLSRRVADTALWLDIVGAVDAGQANALPPHGSSFRACADEDPGRLRIAWTTSCPPTPLPAILSEEIRVLTEATAQRLSALGHQIIDRDPDWGPIATDGTLRYLGSVCEEIDATPHPDRLEHRTRGFGRLGRLVPNALLERAIANEAVHAHRLNAIFDDVDVVLMPCTGTTAFEVGRWENAGALRTLLGMARIFPYTGAWNYTGQPAASVPVGWSRDGLPVGAQFVVAPHREDILIRLAAQLEADIGWPAQRPALAGLYNSSSV